MDIFSCESEMIAANYSDENTHRWSRVLLLSGSMWGHQILITADLNLLSQIQISIFLCFQAYYVVWYLKVSISFKLSFSCFTIIIACFTIIASKWPLATYIQKSVDLQQGCHHARWRTEGNEIKLKVMTWKKFSTKDKMDKNSTASIIM